MADRELDFNISIFAEDFDLSVDDPLIDTDDASNNRLRFVNYNAPSMDLQEQEILSRLQNQPGQYYDVRPSVSDEPSTAPFPLGCPHGMYQQGNVCIPIVGTYPDPTTNAPAAGYDLPKGIIFQVSPPQTTTRNTDFFVQVFFENRADVRGKFFARFDIPDIGIVDSITAGLWVPKFSNASLWKKIRMPASAPVDTLMQLQVELLHLDERNGDLVVDDIGTTEVPSPDTPIPPDDPGDDDDDEEPPPDDDEEPPDNDLEDCYTISGKQYCQVTDPSGRTDCVVIAGVTFCAPEPPPPPGPGPIEEPDCPTGYDFDSCRCKCVAPGVPPINCIRNCMDCPTGQYFNFCTMTCVPTASAQPQCAPGIIDAPTPPPPGHPSCPPGKRWSYSQGMCVPIDYPPEPPDYDDEDEDYEDDDKCERLLSILERIRRKRSGRSRDSIDRLIAKVRASRICGGSGPNYDYDGGGGGSYGNVSVSTGGGKAKATAGGGKASASAGGGAKATAGGGKASVTVGGRTISAGLARSMLYPYRALYGRGANRYSRVVPPYLAKKAYAAGYLPMPPNPFGTPATIALAPSGQVGNGQREAVYGYGFDPGERVDIYVHITWHGQRAYEGLTQQTRKFEYTDAHGSFAENMIMPKTPFGVNGFAKITATGRRSGKTALSQIDIR